MEGYEPRSRQQYEDRSFQSVSILGVNISLATLRETVEWIENCIRTGLHSYITVTPIHALLECQDDPSLKAIFNNSGMTTPDGMGVVWTLKLMGYRDVERVYGPDLMEAVCRESVDIGYRHFLYGGQRGVADELAEALVKRFPGLQIAGTYCPPFHTLSEEENRQVIERIDASGADIVWVGISTPKQERWMAAHVGKVQAPVLIGVGAAFDFLSGRKPQAPRWIQRSGLEWLFRLLSEPRRLWRRYLRYPRYLGLLGAQLLGLKDFMLAGMAESDDTECEVGEGENAHEKD